MLSVADCGGAVVTIGVEVVGNVCETYVFCAGIRAVLDVCDSSVCGIIAVDEYCCELLTTVSVWMVTDTAVSGLEVVVRCTDSAVDSCTLLVTIAESAVDSVTFLLVSVGFSVVCGSVVICAVASVLVSV